MKKARRIRIGLAFHCHHKVLVELCTDYDDRLDFIKRNKPANEIPTRCRLFRLIPDSKLPEKIVRTVIAYRKARNAYVKARIAYNKTITVPEKVCAAFCKTKDACIRAWAVCDDMIRKNRPFFKKLHKKECGCKEWNGRRIVFE